MHDLDPLDPAYVADVLSRPPFVSIPGVINVRDLGSYPSATYSGRITKPEYLYRSAELSGITPEGKLISWMPCIFPDDPTLKSESITLRFP